MKNIGIYLESTESTGGVNRVASMLASSLCDLGYNIYFISRYKGQFGLFCDDKRVVFHELFRNFHSKYVTYPLEVIKLRKFVKSKNIDVLISTGGIFFAISQYCNVKHIMWDHVSFWHGNALQSYFRRLSSRKADAIVTLTEDNREAFADIKGCKASIMKINNPSALSHVEPNINRQKIVISLGFLARQKGYDLMLMAWGLLPKELQNEWTLQIAGGDEGDLPMLNNIINENKLDRVEILGFRKDVDVLLSQSSIYAMSSRWEGMPMVLLEAQCYGLPIVSFNCKTGPSEIVTPECGILVEAENCQGLADGLEKMMIDDQLREQMSVAAVENVKRFSIESITLLWDKLLKQL